MYLNQPKVIEGTIEITRTAPSEKQGLADLLRQTRFLFTYDVCTLLTSEAILSGAIVVPLIFHPYKKEELEYPFAISQDGLIYIPDDYEQKRAAFLSMITSLDLDKQTKQFAQMAITHFILI